MKRILLVMTICAVFCGFIPGTVDAAAPKAFTLTTKTTYAVTDTATLSAPGPFGAVLCRGYKWIQAVIQTSNTSTSSTFKFQCKLNGGLNWFTVDAVDDSTVVTGDDTIGRVFAYPALADSFRVHFWSEAGGTGTTPTAQYKLSNEPVPAK